MKHLFLLAIAGLLHFGAAAQPSGPTLRIVVPYAPGGGTDNLARLIAPRLSQELGQPVVIDNRPGASSRIGTQEVAKAKPDGLTLLIVDTPFTTNPSLYAKLPYDSERDFAPIALLATAPVILVVHPSLQVNNLRELIALGKKEPLQFANFARGSATGLGGDMFAASAGIKIEHVLYKGAGAVLADLISGNVKVTSTGISSVKQYVESGALKGLAVTGAKRARSLPGVPTFAEAGLPGVDASSQWGVLAPAGTPSAVIQRLNAAFNTAINAPQIADRLEGLGFIPIRSTPEEHRVSIQRETAQWKKVINSAGVRAEE